MIIPVSKADQSEIFTDAENDIYSRVYIYESYIPDVFYNDSDHRPNVDIKSVYYLKKDGSREITVEIEVYGEIEDNGDFSVKLTADHTLYTIYLFTNKTRYLYEYLNQWCKVERDDEYLQNTQFEIEDNKLIASFSVDDANEIIERIIVRTEEIDNYRRSSGDDFYTDACPDDKGLKIPDADLKSDYSGNVGEEIKFSCEPIVAYGSVEDVKYEWDFGDGMTSNGKSPVHSYDKGGSYDGYLTLYNEFNEIQWASSFDININSTELQNQTNNNSDSDNSTPGFEIILAVCSIALILILKKGKILKP